MIFTVYTLEKNKKYNNKFKSTSVSDQLHTYPSPKLTLNLSCHQLAIIEVGEG